MEEKQITPQEGLAIITTMINATKHRVAIPDLKISVALATITVVTALTVFTLLIITQNSIYNILWLAIPVLGYPAKLIITKRTITTPNPKTYIDNILNGIWRIVSYIAILLLPLCGIFQYFGYPQAWLSMYIYAFIIVGFGVAAQGVIIKESSYIIGGIFSILSGFTVLILFLYNTPDIIIWTMPLYALCFMFMFIIPAFIVQRKINIKS